MERHGEIGQRHIVSAGIVAVLLHSAIAVAVFWAPPRSGAIGAGTGGLDISLGAAGGVPGLTAPVTPEATEAVTTDAETAMTPDMAVTLDAAAETDASPDQAETVSAEPETPLEVADVRPVEPTNASEVLQAVEPARDAFPDPPSETAPEAAMTPKVPAALRPETSRPSRVAVTPKSTVARSVSAEPLAEVSEPQTTATLSTEPKPRVPDLTATIAEMVPAQAAAAPTPVTGSAVPAPEEIVTAKSDLPIAAAPKTPAPLAPQLVDLTEADPVIPLANPEVNPAIEETPPVEAAEVSDPELRPVPVPRARPKIVPPAPKRRTARKPAAAQPKTARPKPARQNPRAEPVRQAARPTGDTAEAPSDSRGQGEAGASGNATATGQSNQARAGGNPGAKRDYMSQVAAILSRHKRYPRRAQSRRQEGTGRLFFVVEQNGRVSAMRLQKSSGHRLLDDEILAILGRVGSFPPIPGEIGVARLELVVPINFSLR